jgi:hypothetical protein
MHVNGLGVRFSIAVAIAATLTLSLSACDKKEAPVAKAQPTEQKATGDAPMPAREVAIQCLGEPSLVGATDDPSLKEDSTSYVELRSGERGDENRLVTLALGTGEVTASDWFRRPCSRVVRFHKGLLALCSMSERPGMVNNALYYFEKGKLDAASIDKTPAIGTREVLHFVGNEAVAYYQTLEREIYRLTPALEPELVAKGRPHKVDASRLIYTDEMQKWNSLTHDQRVGAQTALAGPDVSRILPGGGSLSILNGNLVAKDVAGGTIDTSSAPKDLKFFAGNAAVVTTDGKTAQKATAQAGKLTLEELFTVQGGRAFGVWSRGERPHLVLVGRDTNLDGAIGSGDRSEWCVLKPGVTKLVLPERTQVEKDVGAAVDAQLAKLGLAGAKWALRNRGALLTVVSSASTDKTLEAASGAARQIHEAVERADKSIREVLVRFEPGLHQALSRRSASGRLVGYTGHHGALIPNPEDFAFSYEAVSEVITGRSDVTPTGATCSFTARSLGRDPVQAQFMCQLLGPTVYFEKFKPGDVTHLDDDPVFSEVLSLNSKNQKVALRAPGERNKRAQTYQAEARGMYLEKLSDGFDTHLVAVANQWMALMEGMEKQGARIVDPTFRYAQPFAHTRALPRLSLESSATDAEAKQMAKKLLKLLNSHYKNHLRRTTTNFLLQRGEYNGTYDGNTEALTWEKVE